FRARSCRQCRRCQAFAGEGGRSPKFVSIEEATGATAPRQPLRRCHPARGCYFLFGFADPGAKDLASLRSLSFLMSPGANCDFPGSVEPVEGGTWWPGELADEPRLGVPLPAAWARCDATVAATSAAAQIASFFRVMRTPPWIVNDQLEPRLRRPA